jgi:ribosomal protein S18 acetylase RimI-like enzyme
MRPVPRVRPLAAHEWRTYRDLRLRALADSPDAFSSTLAEERDRPDEHWSTRLASASDSELDLPLVAEVGSEPVGLTWARIEASDPATAHIYQMWVAPGSRRLGAGRMLLDAAIRWARSRSVRFLHLGVACANAPATRLYAGAGFEPFGAPEPVRRGSAALMQPMRLELG